MPPIPHWLVFALAVFIPMTAILMSPPTIWTNKVLDALSVHPRLRNPHISTVFVYGVQLEGADRDRFVREFNNANYLFDHGIIPELSKNPIVVIVKQGKKKYEFKMYLYGDHMIEMIRYKNRKMVPYRISSPGLVDLLQSRMSYQWWLT